MKTIVCIIVDDNIKQCTMTYYMILQLLFGRECREKWPQRSLSFSSQAKNVSNGLLLVSSNN